jgi:hypothetical protein
MTSEIHQELLDNFLERWSTDKVLNMTLEEYVSVQNPDTFCQWLETKTRELGSIKGLTSIKFGIYERRFEDSRPKNYANDEKYSWLQGYGKNRLDAFKKVKNEIIEIIKFAEIGDFKAIDNLLLPDLFKWKVAFLYSNERLMPIFKKDVLFSIAQSFGLKTDKHTLISDIQEIMMNNKPPHVDVHTYMRILYGQFGQKKDDSNSQEIEKDEPAKSSKKQKNRKATESKNTDTKVRTIARSFIVTQKHNKLQEALKNKLIAQYGKEAVLLEENYVDIKLLLSESINFYEVKSLPYASDCIREALGQILSYTFNDKDKRKKKIIIVGQYLPNNNETEFIEWLKDNLNIEFEYENIDLND